MGENNLKIIVSHDNKCKMNW